MKAYAERILRWYCKPEILEDILGDLDELHLRQRETTSRRRADRRFAWEVCLLFRRSIAKPLPFFDILTELDMLQNYLKIGFRNLLKHKFSTFIHIFGLAIGLAAFLLINRYTSFERSYDTFHTNPDNLYRLTTDNIVNGQLQVRDAMSFAPSGKVLTDDVPEITGYTTTYKLENLIIRKDAVPLEEQMVVAADSNFLRYFHYPLIAGNAETALSQPNSLVLSEEMALKYFGSTDVIGRSLEVLGRFNRSFDVTGVFAEARQNTHYKFNLLISLGSIQDQIENDEWNGFNYYTYLDIQPGADIAALEKKIEPLAEKYIGENSQLYFNLQPVTDIHLHSDFTFEPEIHGSAKAVRFLSIISIFILVIAWVNYINLSTAKAVERAREVGLRKVVGAKKQHLLGQFFLEAVLINLLGAVTALVLVQLALPYFHTLVGKTIVTSAWSDPGLLRQLALFFVIGIFAAGFYPALVLSSFRPLEVLRGRFSKSQKGQLLRKSLVVIQFAASLILIANTLIVYRQVNYLMGRDKGIDIDRVVGISNPRVSQQERDQYRIKYKAFKDELERVPGIAQVGSMSNVPGGGSSDISSNSGGARIVGLTDRVHTTIYINTIDDQATDLLDMDLLYGRSFHEDIKSDTMAVIVNEALLQKLNVPDPSKVINERLMFGENADNDKYPVVGVISNFNRSTLKNHVEPTVFFYRERSSNTLVKLGDTDLSTAMAGIENTWNSFFPNDPFNYTFLDQRFEKLYMEDRKFGWLFANFSILAIFVASMGLFGLSSFLALRRTKEIGVRKVLGASVGSIVLLFFREFLWLVLYAVIIGVPLVYFSMDPWLSGYAYRIDFPWWILVVSALTVTLFAFMTVGYQNFKVAQLNPATSIRDE